MTDRVDLPSPPLQDWLTEAMSRLARGEPESISPFLYSIGEPVLLDATKATIRTHFIAKDANGFPRVEALCAKLVTRIVDYCIPRSKIDEAQRHLAKTGSTERFAQLTREAKSLFSKLEKSGEGGELLLYFLLESILRIPQILCKMPLKTSSQMHVHGTDGLHAKLLENGNVALYWGESKVHATASSAIDDCFESLAPYLAGELSDSRTRDMLLLRDNLDLGESEVTEAIVRYFIDDDPRSGRIEFRGACLIGFTMSEYPDPCGTEGLQLSQGVVESIRKWHERVSLRIGLHQLESFEIEVFCVPVPSADHFRNAVRKSLDLS